MARQPEEPRGGSAGWEPTDEEVDRRFAELTSALEEEQAGIEKDLADESPAEAAEASTDDGEHTTHGPRDYLLADEPETPFTPPEPEPLSSADPVLLVAWLGAAGGPIVFLLVVLLWPAAPSVVWWTTLVATLAGWGLVVWRLPRNRDGSDDDGAVL